MVKPLIWDGISYTSQKEAAKALGLSPQVVGHRFRKGYVCSEEVEAHKHLEKPTTWNGVVYPSRSAAAIALGISIYALSRRIKRGQISDDDVQRHQESYRYSIDCTWNGISYGSLTAAANAVGITVAAFRARLKRGYASDIDLIRRRLN